MTTSQGPSADDLRALLIEASDLINRIRTAIQAFDTAQQRARRKNEFQTRMRILGLVTLIGTGLAVALGWLRDHTLTAVVLVGAGTAAGTTLAMSPIIEERDPAPAVTVTAPALPGPTVTVTAPAPPRVTKTVTAPAPPAPPISPTPTPIASPEPTPSTSKPTAPGRHRGHHDRGRAVRGD